MSTYMRRGTGGAMLFPDSMVPALQAMGFVALTARLQAPPNTSSLSVGQNVYPVSNDGTVFADPADVNQLVAVGCQTPTSAPATTSMTYTPATVTGGAAAGAAAGSLACTLSGTVSYSVLSGALAVNASTGVLTTTGTAPSSGSIAAEVLADNGTDVVGKHISVPVQAGAVAAPTVTTAPTLSTSSPAVGTAITAAPGVYTGSPTITRQWFYGDTGVAISGATGLSYTPVSADVGHTLKYIETATNGGGSVASAAPTTSAVASPPTATAAPSIAGIAASGNVLTVTPGTYSNATSVTGQWQKNGVSISGQTGTTYTCASTDGPNIAYLETATGPGGTTTQRALSQYRGQVANKCFLCTATTTSSKQFNSRSPHVARDNLTQLQIYIPNWYWDRANTKQEIGSGGNSTYNASIEGPDGTITRLTFSGANSGTAGSGAYLASDLVTLGKAIPNGSLFYVRINCVAATGIVFQSGYAVGSANYSTADFANGQCFEFAASGLTDRTGVSGSFTSTGTTSTAPAFGPTFILSPTRVPSVALLGDSRQAGATDLYDGNPTGLGEMSRQLDLLGVPYTNFGSYGDIAATASTNYALRKAATNIASVAFCEYGINDLSAASPNETAAQLISALSSLWGTLAAAVPLYQSTLEPRSTSTDSWTTLTNQTTDASNPQRVSFNTSVRGVLAGTAGYIEDADVLESARNSGLWAAPGGNALTLDGVHTNPAGYQLLRNSGSIKPAMLAR